MKGMVVAGLSAVALLSTESTHTYGQPKSPSFQYVITAGGDLRGSSITDTAHPGSRQLVYFSNEKLTIAAVIKVEDISGGVARLKVIAHAHSGKVDRQTSERELKSAQPREYTYVPVERLSMFVDGGGVLSLVGAIADEAGKLAKPLAQYPVETEPGQILLLSPVLLRGDRVLVNLKNGAGTGARLNGNPAIALYAPRGGLFIFALQPFEGATACSVTLSRAACNSEGSDYTLFSARPITGESEIWFLRVPTYLPSRVGRNWRDGEAWIRAGALRDLLAEIRLEGFTSCE